MESKKKLTSQDQDIDPNDLECKKIVQYTQIALAIIEKEGESFNGLIKNKKCCKKLEQAFNKIFKQKPKK